ncbi:AAA family ATPase [Vibrio alginolyticus]|uniref:AAA family ATPase n=1 Tax=Vibrio alginolyticus TaxID=663 RepID=UPI001BD53EB9|nr:AAA family ATPase [Vibrio alginolyticus]
MKIESLIIHGLHGTDRVLNIKFFDDVNIITGSNGVGKTTVLKSVWYIIRALLLKSMELNQEATI